MSWAKINFERKNIEINPLHIYGKWIDVFSFAPYLSFQTYILKLKKSKVVKLYLRILAVWTLCDPRYHRNIHPASTSLGTPVHLIVYANSDWAMSATQYI